MREIKGQPGIDGDVVVAVNLHLDLARVLIEYAALCRDLNMSAMASRDSAIDAGIALKQVMDMLEEMTA